MIIIKENNKKTKREYFKIQTLLSRREVKDLYLISKINKYLNTLNIKKVKHFSTIIIKKGAIAPFC